MSCCGCASRVLKLQSEIRSWKTKLADEKREKKMILRWITAVFGYDVRVDIDKETHGIRLQASENKEAVAKALIKIGLGGGNEGDVGMMVMELKLEDHEFYEPFEEPHDIPEFPILEINSMSTQAPLVNTGISALGHISQQHAAPTLSITTPMEVTSTPLPVNSGTDQEVVYIAGNFEEGATLEGINGQSYIIVRTNESEDMPMQLDYAVTEDVIGEGNNLFFRPSIPSVQGTQNAINYLSTTPKNTPIQLSLPTVVTPIPDSLAGRNIGIVPETVIEELQSSVFTPSSVVVKSPAKKKSSLSSTKQISQISGNSFSKKQKSGETNIKIKNVVSKAQSGISTSKQTKNTSLSKSAHSPQLHSRLNDSKPVKAKPTETAITPSSPKKEAFEFGLTLREKAEMYVLQKANDSVEKVGNGFRCTVCLENRYTYSNFETAMAHAKSHYESKPYKCELCDELFAIQKELLTHRKTVHPKPKGVVSSTFSSRLITQQVTQQQPTSKVIVSHTNNASKTSNETIRTISGKISSSTSNVNFSVTGDHSLHPQQAKALIVQSPFDNNLVKGPIRVSNEVLAALLRGSNSSIITEAGTTYVSDNKPSSSSFHPISKIPAIVLAEQGGLTTNKSRNINFSLNNIGGIAYHSAVDSQSKRKQ